VPDTLVGSFQQACLLARGPEGRLTIATPYSPKKPSEEGEGRGCDRGHTRRQEHKQNRERNELSERAKAPEQAVSDTRFDVSNSLGEREHRGGRVRSMIALSRLAQPMSRQECVEEVDSNGATYLSGNPRLNVGGVRARGRLDDDDGQPHE
jgi:hypothetical protein